MSKTHLTFSNRLTIQIGLERGESICSIARSVGKSPSTVTNEIKKRMVYEKMGAYGRPFNDCRHAKVCKKSNLCSECVNPKMVVRCAFCIRCISKCLSYEKAQCPRLLRPPYVCNGCKEKRRCILEKRLYHAQKAQQQYASLLSESRSGINITEEELNQLNRTVSPLVKNGQSVHHIAVNNRDEICYSEKTLYKYVNNGLLDAKNLDMPRVVRFKPRRGQKPNLKVDRTCRIGRTIEDYKLFRKDYPEIPVAELDSVEGIKGGAVLLTVHFVPAKLQLAFLRETNSSKSVTAIFESLYELLKPDDYSKILSLLLADNGTEFSNPKALEYTRDGILRSHVFYCDAAAPAQKGACENNHEFIRRIIPKGVDIGQYSQEQINLMMNHINSYGRPELNNRSPYEMFAFLYGEDILRRLGVIQIPRNEIILKPSLLLQKHLPLISETTACHAGVQQ